MDAIDKHLMNLLADRLAQCASEHEQFLLNGAVTACTQAADARWRPSLYDVVAELRQVLLDGEGLDLLTFRRECRDMSMDDIYRVTGEPGSTRAVLWHIDVAMEMAEMFCNADEVARLSLEAQQARAEAWSDLEVDMMLYDFGLMETSPTDA